MRQISSTLLSVVAILHFAATTRADTLVLANGDRLTGEVIQERDGVILFRSTVLGDLHVPTTNATIARETVSQPVVGTVVSDAAVASVRPATVRRIHARDSAWKRQVELGLSAQDGVRDQTNLSLRLEAARSTPTGSASLLLSHHYGKSDGFLVADATSANALLTRNITDDLFVRGATRYDRDPVGGLEHDAEQSLGLGVTLLDRRKLQFSVGAGAAVRHRNTGHDDAGWNGLVDAFGRVKCNFTDRLSLSQDFTIAAAPAERDDYKLKSHTALVNKLTELLQMSMRYEFEYFGAANSAISARQRFVTAIGCVF